MKKIIYAFMCISSVMMAQNNIEKTGTDVNKKGVPHFKAIIGSDQNSFYTLRVDPGVYKSTYRVEQFNKTDLSSTKEVVNITFKKFTEYQFSHLVKEKIYFFTKQYNTGDKKCELTLDEFAANAVNTESKNRVLITLDTDNSKWYQTMFQYAFSPDGSKIAVITTYIKDVTLYVYDAYTMRELSTKKMSQSAVDNNFIFKYELDNDGNLLFGYYALNAFKVVKQFTGAEKNLTITLKKNPAYTYSSLKFYSDGQNNHVYLYGMFYEMSKIGKLEGYTNGGFYICRIDPKTMAVVSEKHLAFSTEIQDRIKCNKPDGFLKNYTPSLEIVNGSEILLDACSSGGGSNSRGTGTSSYDMSQKVYYFANEIVVAKLNSTLELNWMKLIPRSTFYTNITNNTESTIEYSKIVNNNSVKYVFIEHPKFEQKKIDYTSCNQCEVPNISTYPKTNVVEYSLDLSGKLNKRILYFNEADNWLIPQLYNINVGENKYLVRFRKNKKENFGIINIK